MIIRRIIFEDYEQVEALFQKLHTIHVNAEPDLYKPIDCIHKKRDFKKSVNSKNILHLRYDRYQNGFYGCSLC